ncbi:MAG: hypothetical protein WBE34_01850 [Candidatus Nitrosopolaris sp.]
MKENSMSDGRHFYADKGWHTGNGKLKIDYRKVHFLEFLSLMNVSSHLS